MTTRSEWLSYVITTVVLCAQDLQPTTLNFLQSIQGIESAFLWPSYQCLNFFVLVQCSLVCRYVSASEHPTHPLD